MRTLLTLSILLAFGLAAQARADTITDLGALTPIAVNANDQIVGDVDDNSGNLHAALWNGSLQMLGRLSSTDESDAYAISAGGRIAGDDFGGTSSVHGVYWNGGGTAKQVGPFNGVDDSGDDTVLGGVDTAGDLVGFTPMSSTNLGPTGFLYHAGTEVLVGQTDLGAQPGGTTVGGITPDGTRMLGYIATGSATTYYLWSSTKPSGPGIALNITPPTSDARGLAGIEFGTLISNDLASDGTVLGYTGANRNTGKTFIRLPSGAEVPVNGLFHANAVNNRHVVAGSILGTSMSDPLHAAIWTNGAVTNLNTLLPPGSGWDLIDALAINDNGDIVGIGAHDGKEDGFLLSTSASVSVRFGSIAKAQVGKTVDVPVTVTAGPADLTSVGLGHGLAVSGDHAKVGAEPDGITGFSLSPNESKTFTFKLKGVSVGDAGLSVHVTGRSATGNLTDSADTTVKIWDPRVQVTQVDEPTETNQSGEIVVKYRGLGWDPDGGPIDHSFSGHPLPARPAAATFEGQIHFTLWPQRTTDHHAIEDHGRGGYCWGELATHQGGLYATTDKIRATWGGWVLWSATPVLKAHEAWCEGEQYSFLDKAPAPIVVMGLFKDVKPAGIGIRVYGVRGAGATVLVHPGHILNFHDSGRDVCVAVSADHGDLITTVTHGKCV